ncbi:MAG: flagellar biosynthesis anti-sigma factor FlgM [Gammaproteobacteria bacterium]|nr:flagellar biosynthesis anti-sigma factor FlgM [Gammaproteobacteria bacterium]MBU2286158.1 flagellar biosynthesis anti-sigma factor FlgM [Gammaproteobacteria bacterium]MBU2409515.1 flagellar biosynthesis anti-sigma factor FlgM [Gammaproteobacteria bacterium]
MKINPSNDAALAAAALGSAKAERGTAPAASSKTDNAVSSTPVTVSAAARTLEASGVGSGSGIDETKVAAMRAAIANGTFTVDAGAIADKLLSNAQEFLSRSRS